MNSTNISGSISVINNNINSDHIDVSENTGVISVPVDDDNIAAKEEDLQDDSGSKKSKKHKKKVCFYNFKIIFIANP
jgi:hypothetical protein